jgi:hypothetical protein
MYATSDTGLVMPSVRTTKSLVAGPQDPMYLERTTYSPGTLPPTTIPTAQHCPDMFLGTLHLVVSLTTTAGTLIIGGALVNAQTGETVAVLCTVQAVRLGSSQQFALRNVLGTQRARKLRVHRTGPTYGAMPLGGGFAQKTHWCTQAAQQYLTCCTHTQLTPCTGHWRHVVCKISRPVTTAHTYLGS